MTNTRRVTLLFSPIQFFMWALFTTYLSFLVHFLRQKGYSASVVGTAMTLITLAGILGQMFWGWACDRINRRRWAFLTGIAAATALTQLLQLTPAVPLLFLLMGTIGFFHKPQPAILDSWIFARLGDKPEGFGLIRSSGSLGFALFSVFMGFLIEDRGWQSFFLTSGLLGLMAVLFALLPRDATMETNTDISPIPLQHPQRVNPLEALKIPGYFFLVVISFLLIFPMLTMVLYLAPILDRVGGSASWIGIALFLNAASEVPLFSLSGPLLRRFKPHSLLLTASIVFSLRIILMMVAPSPLIVTLTFLLQSLSFGLFLPSIRFTINRLSPIHLKTTSMTTIESVYAGMGGAAAGFFGGLLLEFSGVQGMLMMALASSLLAMILLLFRGLPGRASK
jgi:predicted MFS family arabinose efflux permease